MNPGAFDRHLAEQAAVRPDAVAVVDGRARWTYRQLDDNVDSLAGSLVAAGIEQGARVVLIADNSAPHLAVAFAIWRAGATLVTIYPSSTEPELRYAIDAAQPALVIAGSRVMATVRAVTDALGIAALELTGSGDVAGLPAAGPPTRPLAPPAALALICFTSGSTAHPKAVMHSHAGLAAAAASYAAVWRLGPADVTLVALPLAWAFGLVTTSMAALTAGGQVVTTRPDPADMLRSIADHRVTFVPGVTTMFVRMLDALDAQPELARPSGLRLCVSGGEPRNDDAFARWTELTGCPVHDVYAASECFPVVTYDPLADPLPRPGCAGRLVPDAEMRLVDGDDNDVGAGPGEAWTRGPALTLGYWRDPELTAAALTPDGWYRTGDLVEIDSEGYVRVVGRLSDMIIRGGANVSPAEVERVLVRHPAVREATVVGLADPRHGQRVVAAVVVEPDAELDPVDLRAHCASHLARYKVPSTFVALADLPRNPNTGKVQRREVAGLLAGLDDATSTGIEP